MVLVLLQARTQATPGIMSDVILEALQYYKYEMTPQLDR